MKKHINIYAYFARNLGDDLMAETLIKRFPKYNFYTERDIKNKALLHHPNFKSKEYYLNPQNYKTGVFSKLFRKKITEAHCIKTVEQIEKNCICSVLIGGSLFAQRNELSNQQVNNRVNRMGSFFNRGPLFVIGANFGAYSTDYFKDSFELQFSKSAGVSFRDTESYNMFVHLPNVQYAPDVVFGYDDIPQKTADSNEIVISVVDITQKYGLEAYCDKYEMFMADLCDYIINLGKIPVLMSFCKTEGDEIAVTRIINKSNNGNLIKTHFYTGDIKSALQRIANSKAVVGTRFHASVLAMRMNKPFYAISYDQKISNMLKDMNCAAFCNVFDIEKLTPEAVLNNLTQIDVSEYKAKSKLHFSQLEKYLSSHKTNNQRG